MRINACECGNGATVAILGCKDKSGVYKNTGGGQMLGGHAMAIIGWGTLGQQNYWLVKNSW